MGLIMTITVARNRNIHISIVGMHRLLGMTAAAVIYILIAVIIFSIAGLLVKFLIEDSFRENKHHIAHDGIDIITVPDRDVVLEKIPFHHLMHGRFFRTSVFSCHKNLHTV